MKLLVILSMAFSLNALAAGGGKKSLHDQATGQEYGMAGCGLGSIVFGDKPGIVQIFAATTNGVSGNQTFGISSGTLNCGESGKSAKLSQFVEVNKVAIENDLARGNGETVTALSKVLECTNSNFSSDMKKNYTNSFPQGGASANQISAVAIQSCNI
jgi:hypothetical protein